MNGSVKWLDVPHFLSNNVPPWTDNILAPSLRWGNGGTATNPNWGSQPGGPYGSVAVPWSGPVHAMTAYVFRSQENTRSTARRVRDDILRENCTARMQSLSTSRNPIRNCLVNRWDEDWYDLWDEPVDQ